LVKKICAHRSNGSSRCCLQDYGPRAAAAAGATHGGTRRHERGERQTRSAAFGAAPARS
jgi:hypothetical protein